MSKAFTKEGDGEDGSGEPEALPAHIKHYMTPAGFAALQNELRQLEKVERPKVVEVVAWAAGNGDRSENGDYIYGKKRLREIDRRLRYISKTLKSAEVVDPQRQQGLTRVFFGATVTYAGGDGVEHMVTLVGVDEADMKQGKISWISPLAKALMKAEAGDSVELRAPGGVETLEVLEVLYKVPE
jgi:transcription elongation factor GreB